MALINFVVIFYFAAKIFEFVSCSSGPLEQPLHSINQHHLEILNETWAFTKECLPKNIWAVLKSNLIFYNFKKHKMFWNERGKCPKVSDAVCFSPRLPISQIGQNEKLLSLISICVAASGEQSQHKKDNIYHNCNYWAFLKTSKWKILTQSLTSKMYYHFNEV